MRTGSCISRTGGRKDRGELWAKKRPVHGTGNNGAHEAEKNGETKEASAGDPAAMVRAGKARLKGAAQHRGGQQ